MSLARYLSTRFVGMRAQREARRFELSVEPGDTYYSVVTCVGPLGEELKVRSWHFNRRAWFGKSPMCGPHSAAYLWLNYGPLLKSPPPGLKDLFDLSGGDALPVDEATGQRLLDQVAREAKAEMQRRKAAV